MKVKDHVILFLDMLGYSSLLSKCKNKEEENDYLIKIRGIMADLANYIDEHNRFVDSRQDLKLSRFKSLLFSDNILFFAPYEDETDMHNLYMNLLYALSLFITQYVKEEIFFRGGITRGNLYYDEQLHFVFGSGLVQAHYLEDKVAIQPRIIIDKSLNPSYVLSGITLDDDGNCFLDYLELGYSIMCNKGAIHREHFENCLMEQKYAVTNALKNYVGCEKVYNKYRWLANYHNQFCQNHKLCYLLIQE